jgi:hypothetical protein
MKIKKVLKAVMKFVVWYVWYFLIVFYAFYMGVCAALPGVYGSEPIPTYSIFPVESCLWFYALSFAVCVLLFFGFGFLIRLVMSILKMKNKD